MYQSNNINNQPQHSVIDSRFFEPLYVTVWDKFVNVQTINRSEIKVKMKMWNKIQLTVINPLYKHQQHEVWDGSGGDWFKYFYFQQQHKIAFQTKVYK